MEKEGFVCTTCGYIGNPVTMTPGSFLVELVLWLLMIVPGLIYTVWRFSGRYKGCPTCKKATMIPVSSPFGRKIIGGQEETKPLLKTLSPPIPKKVNSGIGDLAADYLNKMQSK